MDWMIFLAGLWIGSFAGFTLAAVLVASRDKSHPRVPSDVPRTAAGIEAGWPIGASNLERPAGRRLTLIQ